MGTLDPASRSIDGDIIIESTPRDAALEQFVDGVQFANLEGRFGFKQLASAILILTTGPTCDPLVVPALAGFLAQAG
ncbi:MAG: hypothetical protein HY735_13145 [Verrucomicrobia bacterium]|nr:hypothetical protein [Verrucomicrobiota bacterium]